MPTVRPLHFELGMLKVSHRNCHRCKCCSTQGSLFFCFMNRIVICLVVLWSSVRNSNDYNCGWPLTYVHIMKSKNMSSFPKWPILCAVGLRSCPILCTTSHQFSYQENRLFPLITLMQYKTTEWSDKLHHAKRSLDVLVVVVAAPILIAPNFDMAPTFR